MSEPKVRIGVIGAGAIGPSHIFAIDQVEGAELAAVCDQVAERAESLAEEHGVPWFKSVGEMLRADAVDAVTIGTPSGFHLETALEVIEGGKHLLIEKPMEIVTERIDRITAAAAAQQVKLSGVYQSRFRPVPQQLKEMVDKGMLGEIYSGSAYTKRYRTREYYESGGWRGTWEVDGGGCLMNQGIHLVDLLVWFMGEAKSAIGMISSVGRPVEVDTLAMGLVEFESGAKGVIEGTTLAYPEFPQYMEIVGSRGTVVFAAERIMSLDLIDPTPAEAAAREELLANKKAAEQARAEKRKDTAPGTAVPDLDMGHAPVFEDFVEAIRTGRDPLVPGREARRSVELINAIYESGRNNSKPVRLRG